ncbi:unnamed protein product [Polarella glacialis]|uniref:Uncharacterized protein n=1 Tax=Polarella glacialis TaxID=89957 RepID=A0A813IRK0_POLGL|nr:unnamed protein product [Polarella glacialis]
MAVTAGLFVVAVAAAVVVVAVVVVAVIAVVVVVVVVGVVVIVVVGVVGVGPDQCMPSGIVRRGVQGMALFRSMESDSQKSVCTTVAFLWQRFPSSSLPS